MFYGFYVFKGSLYYDVIDQKVTIKIMLKNPTCKDVNARFTTVPLRALSNHVLIRHINVYNLKKRIIFNGNFSSKVY